MPKPTQNPIPATVQEASAAFARPHDYVAVDGGRLAYWRFGRGPDVVLVHGWPLHAATFRAIVPALAKEHTLHLFDLPGTGHTEWHGPIGFQSHAVALRAAIDALGIARYALVAHDSGGTIARLLAADDARAEALVLGNTELTRHHPFLLNVYAWAAKRPRIAALLLAAMKLGVLRRSPLGFGGCFTDPRFVDGEFGALFVRPLLTSREVATGQMGLVRNLDFGLIDRLDEVHARIHAPVLCIWGTDDPFFPLPKARRMLAELPGGAELVEIAGGKLFAHEDHADAFAAHTLRFLARHGHRTESAA
jgi:haloalkane dehalogenase